jgi:hypothetical protein
MRLWHDWRAFTKFMRTAQSLDCGSVNPQDVIEFGPMAKLQRLLLTGFVPLTHNNVTLFPLYRAYKLPDIMNVPLSECCLLCAQTEDLTPSARNKHE